MKNSSTAVSQRQIKVPFHGVELYVVEYAGQPYTPMKPIVEGMGLDWGGQHKKLAANEDRWGCVSVTGIQLPGDTQRRDVLCLPLRKVGGWLMTVHASRVRAEIRDRIVQFQNECDDVLWQYWNDGIAINPRMGFTTGTNDVLTADQQETLRLMVKTLVERLPKAKQGGAAIKVWSKLKAHFKVAYRQIPQHEFAEAVSIITRTVAEWEVVDEEPEPAGIKFVVPGHGRYLVVTSALGAYVYNVGGFQLVAKDTASRIKLEMLALSEELARMKTRLGAFGGDDDPIVLRPVAVDLHVI
jgi:hypothetical protein